MQKTLVLAFLAILTLLAAVFFLPQLMEEPEAPVMRWDASQEVDGSNDAEPETESGTIDRTAAETGSPAPTPVSDNEPRIDATLRGRVVNKFKQPVAGAKVWLEIGQARGQTRGGRGGRGRTRRIPEPIVTNADGLFAFQGEAFRNLRVSLQVKHDNYAVGLFTENLGDILGPAPAAGATAEVALKDLVINAGGTVRGRVTDLDGNGVVNASISMEPDGRNRMRWQRNREELLPPIQTDNNGYYSYTNVPASNENNDFTVRALAKMHTPGQSSRITIAEDAVIEVPDIQLGPGYEVTGIVRNREGQPIANANITMTSMPQDAAQGDGAGRGDRGGRTRGGRGGRGRGGFGRGHRTKTDEAGRFFLEHLPGAMMELRATAKGFLDYEQENIDIKLGQLLHVTMEEGLRITGVVQAPDGTPITSYALRAAYVRALPKPGEPAFDLDAMIQKMRSGDLDDGARRQLMRQVETMRRRATSNAGTGRGGRGGGRGGGGGGRQGRGGRSNLGDPEPHPEGKFATEGLQEGIYEVLVQAPEFALTKSPEVAVRSGMASPNLTIVVDPGVYVAGVVLDDFGDPIASAEVELRTSSLEEASNRGNNNGGRPDFGRMARNWMRGNSASSVRLDVRTDEDGMFVIKHVPLGVYRLSASADGFADDRTEPFELQGNRSNFELRVKPLGSIVGTVSGLRPDEAGTVQIGAVMIPEGGGMPNMFGRGGRGGNSFKTGKVEADGSYRLEGLTPGNYVVRSWVGSSRQLMRELGPDFMSGNLQADVTVAAGDPTRFDTVLKRPEVGVVTGTVTHNGDSASGFRVELRKQDNAQPAGGGQGGRGGRMANFFSRNLSATVSATGEFTLKDVPAGLYNLRISASRRGSPLLEETVQVFANDTLNRSFALQTGSLKGTLTSDDGADVSELGGRVSMVADQVAIGEDLNKWLREQRKFDARIQNGAFEFASLPPGSYLLVLQPRRREVTSQIVTIGGAETVSVVVGKAKPANKAGGGGNR